jgi:hypothetical protein
VFILDGADECLTSVSPDEAYAALIGLVEKAMFRTNQLIVTSRPNLLTASHIRRLQEFFDVAYISFPRLGQIFEYLQRRKQVEMLSIAQRPGNEHFAELIKRPLFLDMALASSDLIPDAAPVSDAVLFDRYFETWYLRELLKLGPQTRTLSKDQMESTLSAAAYEMFSRGTGLVSEESFAQTVELIAGANIRGELDNLKNQARNRLLLIPVEIQSEKFLTFKHDALRSYFLAVHLQNRLMKGGSDFTLPDGLDSLSLSFFVTHVSSTAAAAQMLTNLKQRAPGPAPHGADVLDAAYLLATLRNTPVTLDVARFRHFCAEAPDEIRLLVLTHLRQVVLSGLNLSGINLKGAVLQNAHMGSINLSCSDLSGARLDGARLSHACEPGHESSLSELFRPPSASVGQSEAASFDDLISWGLTECSYCVLVVSPAFVKRPWGAGELDRILMLKESARIIFVCLDVDEEDVRAISQIMCDKGVFGSRSDLQAVTKAVRERMRRAAARANGRRPFPDFNPWLLTVVGCAECESHPGLEPSYSGPAPAGASAVLVCPECGLGYWVRNGVP